jgi:hypothetical protein
MAVFFSAKGEKQWQEAVKNEDSQDAPGGAIIKGPTMPSEADLRRIQVRRHRCLNEKENEQKLRRTHPASVSHRLWNLSISMRWEVIVERTNRR